MEIPVEQTVTITDVNAEDIDILWEKVKGNLALAIEYSRGEYTLEDIHLSLISGFMKLWIGYDKDGKLLASAVCELVNYPQKKVCYVVLAGGGFFDIWTKASVCIEDWALANGADTMAAFTRRGVAKKMKAFDYNEVYTVIQKDLTKRRLH